MQEKRKFARYDIPFQVKFKTSQNKNTYALGVTFNFSEHGLCFELDINNFFQEGIFELNIKHPNKGNFVPVVGDIVWTRQVESKCLVGLKLIEMDKNDKRDILEYVRNKWT